MPTEDPVLKSMVDWANAQTAIVLADLKVPKGLVSLVFSSRKGQCPLLSNRLEIYRVFPEFFDAGSVHATISGLIVELNRLDRQKKTDEVEVVLKEVQALLNQVPVAPDVTIEFRFERLDAVLIDQMKKHPLVSQPPELMRPASIRVILSSFAEAAEK